MLKENLLIVVFVVILQKMILVIYVKIKRDRSVICVVEDDKDMYSDGKMREYKGLYHVSTWFDITNGWYGPEDINIPALVERLKSDEVKELILAMNPNLEGESTAMYISEVS